MDNKKIRAIGAAVLVAVWLGLTGWAWFGPAKDFSDAERRPLTQAPEITAESILEGKFMGEFEDYTLDQFPLRDTFRKIKSLFHYNALNQGDNNGIYVAEGFAAKQEYPLSQVSVKNAMKRFEHLYQKYLKPAGSKATFVVVPDKSYYLAERNGHLVMDYEAMFALVRESLPWATHVDLTDCLSVEDYYFTDTHWRQEKLIPAARKLAEAMGITPPEEADFTATKIARPFYGVYYGQAALPMEPEELYIMESQLLSGCTVYNHENGKTTAVYDMDKLNAKDLYDVFLSGAAPLLTIDNPNAATDKELIVFRDSFGSSMVPLLIGDYRTVTVVDIRYIASDFLSAYMDFHGQDVLFLYSTLILNSSSTLK